MKIALYQPWIYLHGGLEKSLLELVTRSEHEWVVYTGYYDADNTFKEFKNVNVQVLNPTTVKRNIKGTLKSAWQAMTQKIPREPGFDAIAIWCDGIGDLVAYRNHDLPLINICSTPLRAAYDPVYEQISLKDQGMLYVVAYQSFKYLFRVFDRVAWSFFDGVITTSTEVKNRIVQGKLCVDETKMVMAYPGIEWRQDISDVSYEPMILVSGRIMWTKNIQQAILAFAKAKLPAPWRLVIAGFVDEKSKVYLQELQSLIPDGLAVEFVISPSSELLNDLYKRASFCLFTPLNEDWGIVPLECMNYGKAVIANASGGPLESIISGKTGYLLPSHDIDAWAEALNTLANDPVLCRTLGQQAHMHVKQFEWQEFVRRIDQSITLWVQEHATKSLTSEQLTENGSK